MTTLRFVIKSVDSFEPCPLEGHRKRFILLNLSVDVRVNPLLRVDQVERCDLDQISIKQIRIRRIVELAKQGKVDHYLQAVDHAPQLAE